MLVWDDIFTFGVDLMGFEVFKTVNGTDFDYTSPFDTPTMNMSVDPEVSPGDVYDYRVRSNHQFGVTSNLSNILTVTIPYPFHRLQFRMYRHKMCLMMKAGHFRYRGI